MFTIYMIVNSKSAQIIWKKKKTISQTALVSLSIGLKETIRATPKYNEREN